MPPKKSVLQNLYPQIKYLEGKELERFKTIQYNRKWRKKVKAAKANAEPEPCRRVGFVITGGHCVVCGIDVPPGIGIRAGLTTIACEYKKCQRLSLTIDKQPTETFHRSRKWLCGR